MKYNQVVVICQILQECFLQNFKKKFHYMEHSNSRTFKDLLCFQGLSRALNFFLQIQGLSRTSQGPYEPWSQSADSETLNFLARSHASMKSSSFLLTIHLIFLCHWPMKETHYKNMLCQHGGMAQQKAVDINNYIFKCTICQVCLQQDAHVYCD